MSDQFSTLSATTSDEGSYLLFSTLTSLCLKCTTFATSIVAIAAGLLYFKQDSLLYFPAIGGVPRHPAQNPRRYRSPSEHNLPFETHSIPCRDGTNLHSWLLYHPESRTESLPTIVFFHGNAGNIGLRLPNAIQMYHYLKANIWLVEYRGYGDSDDAKIDEAGLKMDAEAVLQYTHDPKISDVNNHLPYVDRKRLFVFGRSLGGAVAFHLAHFSQSSKYPPLAGVIVENTFLSISEMVDHLMPYVAPFKSLILRIGWDSGKIAPSITVPTLFLAGAKDTLVPHSHMLKLFQMMKSATGLGHKILKMHIVQDGTHNETWMQGGKEYWGAIQKFLEEVFADGHGSSQKEMINGPVQRKGSSSNSISSCPLSGALEVSMGTDREESATSMIPSVENFIGMAREATRSAANNSGVTSAKNPKPYKKTD